MRAERLIRHANAPRLAAALILPERRIQIAAADQRNRQRRAADGHRQKCQPLQPVARNAIHRPRNRRERVDEGAQHRLNASQHLREERSIRILRDFGENRPFQPQHDDEHQHRPQHDPDFLMPGQRREAPQNACQQERNRQRDTVDRQQHGHHPQIVRPVRRVVTRRGRRRARQSGAKKSSSLT